MVWGAGSGYPSNTWLLEPTRPNIPNGISIEHTLVTNGLTDRTTTGINRPHIRYMFDAA